MSLGKDAERNIREELHGVSNAGTVEFRKLDVSSLASAKAFTDGFKQSYDRVGVLIQNAGVLLPHYATSDDGIETQRGALPSLYAASAPGVQPNDYFGPDGMGHMTGYPAREEPQNESKSPTHAAKLWEVSERLAKLQFQV